MSSTMYTVSSSPHIRSKDSISNIMRDVLIALLPATAAGIYFFKTRALLIILVSIASCVGAEALWQKITKRKITIGDYSAAVTGLLLALNMLPSVPLWIPIIGGAFAIIIVKQFFGGLGQNFMNPALAARAFLQISYPVQMNTWMVDGVSSATTLGILKEGGGALPSIWNLFIGNVGGTIGETSAAALLIGGLYLICKRVISWRTPVFYIGTAFILSWIFGRNGFFTGNPMVEILAGGLMLGAIFMATDYSTSPVTPLGQIVMGIGCALLTTVIRVYGAYPEGVSYSILIMNLFVPIIDQLTTPKVFGGAK